MTFPCANNIAHKAEIVKRFFERNKTFQKKTATLGGRVAFSSTVRF